MSRYKEALRPFLKVLLAICMGAFGIGWCMHAYHQSSQWDNLVHQYIQESTTEMEQTTRALSETLVPSDHQQMMALFQRMDTHLELHQAVLAIAEGEALLRLDPDNLAVLLRLGMIYLQQEQYEEAQIHFKTVYQAEEASSRPLAAWYLALVHGRYGQTQQCQMFLREAAAGDAHTHQATRLLALIKA